MQEDTDALVGRAIDDFNAAADVAALEHVKAQYLGKSGYLTVALKSLGKLPYEERRDAGARINQAKERIESALVERRAALAGAADGPAAHPQHRAA